LAREVSRRADGLRGQSPLWESPPAPPWCPRPTFFVGATYLPILATSTGKPEGYRSLEVHSVGVEVVEVCGSRGEISLWAPLGGLGHGFGGFLSGMWFPVCTGIGGSFIKVTR